MATRRPIIVGQLYLDSGTQFWAQKDYPTVLDPIYVGRIKEWGSIDRSIPVPAGLPQIGDARVRVIDIDRDLRDLLSTETPRRRFMVIKLLFEGDDIDAVDPVYTGEVVDADFEPGLTTLNLRDRTFAWIDEEIPRLGTRANFPGLAPGIDEFDIPIINGNCVSREDNPTGVIPLPHVGFNSESGDRYAVAAHPVWDVPAVYRKETGDGAFTVVDPSEYNITVENIVIDGVDLNITWLDFLSEQPDGTEIRADVEGIYGRGAWGSLPEVGFDAATGAIRNPIDFFINMTFFVLAKAGLTAAFDTVGIAAVRTAFESMIVDSGSSTGFQPYYCDGAVLSSITCREFLAQFLASFNLDMYQTKHGLITLGFTDGTRAGRPVFNESRHILRNSFKEQLAKPTTNRLRYSFERNYATNQWGSTEIGDNTEDQNTLGSPVMDSSGGVVLDSSGNPTRTPQIEEGTFELWFVRDAVTAADVTGRRLSTLALGSYRSEWLMPAPVVMDDVELAALVGVTTHWGLAPGGYENTEVKITGLTLDLDKLLYTVRAIVRVPQTVSPGLPAVDGAGELALTFSLAGEGETG